MWRIEYYESNNKKESPVKDFIESLNINIQAKLAHTLDLLEEFGTNLGLPHVKKLKASKLWELRVLGKDNIRVLYIAFEVKTFLLLHGFVKKKQKTDDKEISIALKRLDEYRR